ncbi:MAG: hypothetical protein HUN04_16590 [Desulfobacter sp.]|nr:MAG: hypothetical protein HUN04_16590 [Desulfobacter sp.]
MAAGYRRHGTCGIMILPGGTWDNAFKVSREFEFAPLTGRTELALAETLPRMKTAAGQVTAVLSAVLSTLGGKPADRRRVHQRLSIGDREFLMRLAARNLGKFTLWHAARCRRCKALFDLEVDEIRLPVRQAAAGYPLAKAATSQGEILVKVPTGEDLDRAGTDRTALGRQLVVTEDPSIKEKLTPRDITAIETAVQALSPEITRQIQTRCPECSQENIVDMDPYGAIPHLARTPILTEVDRMARAYHWNETEILNLPQKRRQAYLDLIDKHQIDNHQGMASHPRP